MKRTFETSLKCFFLLDACNNRPNNLIIIKTQPDATQRPRVHHDTLRLV